VSHGILVGVTLIATLSIGPPVSADAESGTRLKAAPAAEKARLPLEEGVAKAPAAESKEAAAEDNGASASANAAPTPSPGVAKQTDEDLSIDPIQPDFAVMYLPTTARLPKGKGSFMMTHRFGRSLTRGSVGSTAGDLFGLDNGAQIGLGFRYAPMRGAQIGLYRSSGSKTVEFFGQYALVDQTHTRPVGVGAFVSVEGRNNFKEQYSPALGVVLSRTLSDRLAVYAQPIWIGRTSLQPRAVGGHDNTMILGLSARLRLGASSYVVAEVSPRVAGYKPGTAGAGFGLEKRVGGHVFQLNFSNSFGSTLAQIARGGLNSRDWYLGFNLTRKFY
jgi:hypothetical protein